MMTLRAARERRGWSGRRLARAAYVDPALVFRWEAGTRPIPLATVPRLAALLDAPELLTAACAACPVGQACGQPVPGEVA